MLARAHSSPARMKVKRNEIIRLGDAAVYYADLIL